MFDISQLFNMFGGQNGFQQRFAAFAQQFAKQNQMTPEQKVQQMLNSGQMSQQQFNTFAQIADRLVGRRF